VATSLEKSTSIASLNDAVGIIEGDSSLYLLFDGSEATGSNNKQEKKSFSPYLAPTITTPPTTLTWYYYHQRYDDQC